MGVWFSKYNLWCDEIGTKSILPGIFINGLHKLLFVTFLLLFGCTPRPDGVPRDAKNTGTWINPANWISCGSWRIGETTRCTYYYLRGGIASEGTFLIDSRKSQFGTCLSLGESDHPRGYCGVFFAESLMGLAFRSSWSERRVISLKSYQSRDTWNEWSGIHPLCHAAFEQFDYWRVKELSRKLFEDGRVEKLITEFARYLGVSNSVDNIEILKQTDIGNEEREGNNLIAFQIRMLNKEYTVRILGGCMMSIMDFI